MSNFSEEEKENLRYLHSYWSEKKKSSGYENGKTYKSILNMLNDCGIGKAEFHELILNCIQNGRNFLKSEIRRKDKFSDHNKEILLEYLDRQKKNSNQLEIEFNWIKNYNNFMKK